MMNRLMFAPPLIRTVKSKSEELTTAQMPSSKVVRALVGIGFAGYGVCYNSTRRKNREDSGALVGRTGDCAEGKPIEAAAFSCAAGRFQRSLTVTTYLGRFLPKISELVEVLAFVEDKKALLS